MEYYNPPRLKAGWMGTSRLHRCEDGHFYGSAVLCGFNLNRLLVSARH